MSDEVSDELREVVTAMVGVYLRGIDAPDDVLTTVHCSMMGQVLSLHIGVGEEARMAMTFATAASEAMERLRTPRLRTSPVDQDPDKPEIPRILL